jgi:hypothetical protein
MKRDPPSMKWSDLKYVIWHQGGPICRGRGTSLKRLSRSCGRLTSWSRKARALLTLTGRGADYIIIDDPVKPDEALSDAQRREVNAWFSHSLFSRLNSKTKGVIKIVMQRLHEDDLTHMRPSLPA